MIMDPGVLDFKSEVNRRINHETVEETVGKHIVNFNYKIWKSILELRSDMEHIVNILWLCK